MKIAIVQDSIVSWGGAERVLQHLISMFPQADLFSTVFFPPEGLSERLAGKTPRTTFVQRLPLARRLYRSLYFPLMPIAIEQLDLSPYDLVISSSFSVAKGVLTRPDQVHVCYIHSPARYAWDLQSSYLSSTGFARGLRNLAARWAFHKFRVWDVASSARVDHFIANSNFVAARVRKYYRRDAAVVYPPVDFEISADRGEKRDYYLAVSRLVEYKRVDLLVGAFAKLPERRLLIVGDGPQFKDLKRRATSNTSLLGFQSDAAVRDLMRHARALVFAAEEDFGMTVVEAQACGTPVIAYGRGGVLESVSDHGDARTGVFFREQSPQSLCAAVAEFEGLSISAEACRQSATRFSAQMFRERMTAEIDAAFEKVDRRGKASS